MGKWSNEVAMIGNWLYYSFPISHPWNTLEDYPNWVKDRHYASNLAERIPAFYVAKIPIEENWKWVKNIVQLFPEYEYYLQLKFYGLKTFPLQYLGVSYYNFTGYDDPKIIEFEDQIRILWREIEDISIDNTTYNVTGVLYINIKPNTEIRIRESHTNREYKYFTHTTAKSIIIIDYNNPLR